MPTSPETLHYIPAALYWCLMLRWSFNKSGGKMSLERGKYFAWKIAKSHIRRSIREGIMAWMQIDVQSAGSVFSWSASWRWIEAPSASDCLLYFTKIKSRRSSIYASGGERSNLYLNDPKIYNFNWTHKVGVFFRPSARYVFVMGENGIKRHSTKSQMTKFLIWIYIKQMINSSIRKVG